MPCCGLGSSLFTLEQLTAPQSEHQQHWREDNGSFVSCPSCGWEITSEFTWCPHCGLRAKPYQCTYCQGWVPVGLTDCPHCGAP